MIESRLQIAQKDLTTIRDREAQLTSEKVLGSFRIPLDYKHLDFLERLIFLVYYKHCLHHGCNLTPVNNVCKAASLWAPNGLNKLPEVHFEANHGAYSVVHIWGPRARISALFRRWT